MRKGNFLAVLAVFLFSCVALVSNVMADNTTGSGRKGSPPTNPEPLSCILVVAGGATLVALRRWKAKRSCKELDKHV